MMGLGVTHMDVFEMVPSRRILNLMLKENMVETEKLCKMVEAYKNQDTNPQCMDGTTSNLISASSLSSAEQHKEAQASQNIILPLENNCSVWILSVTDPSKVVAKGYVCSLDPTAIVGGEELEKNWCSVFLSVAVERDERLIRTLFMTQTIGEAIGVSVAWPSNLVSFIYLLVLLWDQSYTLGYLPNY